MIGGIGFLNLAEALFPVLSGMRGGFGTIREEKWGGLSPEY
jgi:hypothetical protein